MATFVFHTFSIHIFVVTTLSVRHNKVHRQMF